MPLTVSFVNGVVWDWTSPRRVLHCQGNIWIRCWGPVLSMVAGTLSQGWKSKGFWLGLLADYHDTVNLRYFTTSTFFFMTDEISADGTEWICVISLDQVQRNDERLSTGVVHLLFRILEEQNTEFCSPPQQRKSTTQHSSEGQLTLNDKFLQQF